MIAIEAVYDFITVVVVVVVFVILVTFPINSAFDVPCRCLQYFKLPVLPFCNSFPFYCNNIVVYV